MTKRKYIHLHLSSWKHCTLVQLNGKRIHTDVTIGKTDIDWSNLNQGSKNLSLAICKELYPGHENDLREKFLKDYISKLKDSDIVEVNVDITEFCKYARDVIRIKQEKGVESIEDCLPF